MAQGAVCPPCTPTCSLKLTSNRLHSERTPQGPLQWWQLQAEVVVGCPGTSLLPCTPLLPGPGSSLMPSAPRAGLDVTSSSRGCCQPVRFLQSMSMPVSHLNCRALGRGPCCFPTPITGPRKLCPVVPLQHNEEKMRRWGRGEATVLPVQ